MHDNRIKVLVVEDEASIRRFITLNLEMADMNPEKRRAGRMH